MPPAGWRSLQEQVILMSDHLWLVNSAALFSDSRYIMRVAPSHKKPTEIEMKEVAVEDFGDRVGAKLTQSGNHVEKSIQFVDMNTRFLLGQHYAGLDHTITNLHLLKQ